MTGVTYNWDFSFLWMYRWLLLKGIGFTLLYTVGSIIFGLILGLLVGVLRLSKSWFVNLPLIAYIEAFRCTPLLVQIIWFYYAFPVLVGLDMPAVVAGMLVLSLYTGAFYAEIFRGGVISMERGQVAKKLAEAEDAWLTATSAFEDAQAQTLETSAR